MNEQYEIIEVDFLGLPKRLIAPKGTESYSNAILTRFYEPNYAHVPNDEINSRSKMGIFREPQFCYDPRLFSTFSCYHSGLAIIGEYKELDHVLNLIAGYDISRTLGKELVKLLIAKRFAEGNPDMPKTKEQKQVLARLERIVKKAWIATMRS